MRLVQRQLKRRKTVLYVVDDTTGAAHEMIVRRGGGTADFGKKLYGPGMHFVSSQMHIAVQAEAVQKRSVHYRRL
jgi:hypothetical protein